MSGCMFDIAGTCNYREMIPKAIKDCPFMNEDKSCKATEGDLVDYEQFKEREGL
jgi:hypothetical protein